MTFGHLKYVGKTYASDLILPTDTVLVDVYECEDCKSRQKTTNNGEGCFNCKNKAVKEHHEEEGKAGNI